MPLYSQMCLCIWTHSPKVNYILTVYSASDVASDQVRLETSFLYRVAIPLKVPWKASWKKFQLPIFIRKFWYGKSNVIQEWRSVSTHFQFERRFHIVPMSDISDKKKKSSRLIFVTSSTNCNNDASNNYKVNFIWKLVPWILNFLSGLFFLILTYF